MPDKAIDLIDEAASKLRMQQESKPEAVDMLERELIRYVLISSFLLSPLFSLPPYLPYFRFESHVWNDPSLLTCHLYLFVPPSLPSFPLSPHPPTQETNRNRGLEERNGRGQ